MNRQNYTNFERNLGLMVTYLPVKFEFNWIKGFRVKFSSPEMKMWTDRRTDIGHINPIGGLVTCNSPKKDFIQKISNDKHNLIIIDDLQVSAIGSEFIANLFSRELHHKNLSVFLVLQNLFN